MPRPFKITLALLVILTFLIVPFWLASLKLRQLTRDHSRAASIQSFGPAPDFELISENQTPVSRNHFEGQVWVADFFFTRCPTVCSLMTEKMKELEREFPSLTLVSFSVDPKYDTPEILQKYRERYRIETPNWYFLTGPWEMLNQAAKGFKVTTGEDEPMFHSTRLILIDDEGQIRGYFDPADEPNFILLKQTLRALIK